VEVRPTAGNRRKARGRRWAPGLPMPRLKRELLARAPDVTPVRKKRHSEARVAGSACLHRPSAIPRQRVV
jgi:hypothetical protein